MKKIIPYLLIIPLTVFYMYFTATYMWYFDIGINRGVRTWDINWIRSPVAVMAQVVAVFFGNRFIGNMRWQIVLHLTILIGVICLVFAGFAIFDNGVGIPRRGGFLRFLGYYFLNMEEGQMPDGTWE